MPRGTLYSEDVRDEGPRRQQQHEDTGLEAQQMNYASVKTSPQQFNPIVDQNLGENQDATKGCTELHPDKTNIEIDSQHLIPDELLQSINLDYNLSEKIVHHDVRITDEKIDKINLSDSQFTISDELLPSLNAYWRESITTDSSVTREEEPSNEYFNDKKSESVVQDHCQDCGLYMITYEECLSYGHKVLVNEFDSNALRKRYAALLWNYETRKQDANAHSDVEVPLRPARQSRITSVIEVFDV
ncbi:hypothetical protein FXO38_18186 [Capsicum annuum]|nr:hypothetical protein FXO38_18186 [Capsicum annuum]